MIHSTSIFRGKASDPVSVALGNWRPDERHAISRSAKENLKELRRSKMTTSGYKWEVGHDASVEQGKKNALSSSKANWKLNWLISHPLRKFHGDTYPLT